MLDKRKENHERLSKSYNVDQSLLDNALKENEDLKEKSTNLKLLLQIKQNTLHQKNEELNLLKTKKKSIENRVNIYIFYFN